jgi:putative oxidoreductase
MKMTSSPRWTGWTQLLLRLVVGFGFAAHGYAKLARGPEGFAAILLALHVPAPHVMAWTTALLELFGGIGVMAGAFVPLLALPLAAILVTAAITVHLPYGFSSVRLTAVTTAGAQFGPIGYELDLLYFVSLLTLALGGPGPFSLDAWRRARWPASRR